MIGATQQPKRSSPNHSGRVLRSAADFRVSFEVGRKGLVAGTRKSFLLISTDSVSSFLKNANKKTRRGRSTPSQFVFLESRSLTPTGCEVTVLGRSELVSTREQTNRFETELDLDQVAGVSCFE